MPRVDSPTVFWSNALGGYDALATAVTATTASASVMHFSHGFCGEGKGHQGMDAATGGDSTATRQCPPSARWPRAASSPLASTSASS